MKNLLIVLFVLFCQSLFTLDDRQLLADTFYIKFDVYMTEPKAVCYFLDEKVFVCAVSFEDKYTKTEKTHVFEIYLEDFKKFYPDFDLKLLKSGNYNATIQILQSRSTFAIYDFSLLITYNSTGNNYIEIDINGKFIPKIKI